MYFLPCYETQKCHVLIESNVIKTHYLHKKNNTIIALERELVCLTLFFGSKHQKNDT